MTLLNIKFDNNSQQATIDYMKDGEHRSTDVTFGCIFHGCGFDIEALKHVIDSIENQKNKAE